MLKSVSVTGEHSVNVTFFFLFFSGMSLNRSLINERSRKLFGIPINYMTFPPTSSLTLSLPFFLLLPLFFLSISFSLSFPSFLHSPPYFALSDHSYWNQGKVGSDAKIFFKGSRLSSSGIPISWMHPTPTPKHQIALIFVGKAGLLLYSRFSNVK